MNWFKKKIEIKYCRIRKPKKDEVVIFQLLGDVTQEQLDRFTMELRKMNNDKGRYIVVNRLIKVISAKRKQLKRTRRKPSPSVRRGN